jgi:hypothetical protein
MFQAPPVDLPEGDQCGRVVRQQTPGTRSRRSSGPSAPRGWDAGGGSRSSCAPSGVRSIP